MGQQMDLSALKEEPGLAAIRHLFHCKTNADHFIFETRVFQMSDSYFNETQLRHTQHCTGT